MAEGPDRDATTDQSPAPLEGFVGRVDLDGQPPRSTRPIYFRRSAKCAHATLRLVARLLILAWWIPPHAGKSRCLRATRCVS